MDSISKLNVDDSASEKLVEEKGEPNSKELKVEIKYMAEPQNGETKIDIENLGTAFVGMGKEELMKFAKDPFWVKMRWFLFISFWILWFAMLAGAVAIIVLAPKCAAPSTLEWYEQSPIYEVDIRNLNQDLGWDSDKSNIEGLELMIGHFKDIGIETLLLKSIMKSHGDSDHIEDFKVVDPEVGTIDELKHLLHEIKEKGMHLLLSFVPNYSSDTHEWFVKSISQEEPYKDYYIWAPAKGRNNDGQLVPPNNWLSITGGSAWEWNEKRGEFYLHQFNKSQPDFNFHNKDVVQYFKDVFKFWLDIGVSGFHLDQVEFLMEDIHLANESIDSNARGVTHDQYAFFTHLHTANRPENIDLLQDWSTAVKNNSGVLLLTSLSSKDNEKVSHLVFNQLELSAAQTATDLERKISSCLNTSSPVWEWVCKDYDYCISKDLAKGLQMALLLLPGTTVIKSKDFPLQSILHPNKSVSNNSSATEEVENVDFIQEDKILKSLLKIRSSPSIIFGDIESHVYQSTVFAFSRIKIGNEGYVAIVNFGDEESTVDLQKLKNIPDKVVVIASSQYSNGTLTTESELPSKAVPVLGKTGIILSFVPPKKK